MTVRRNIGFGLATQRRPQATKSPAGWTRRWRWCGWSAQADKLPGQLSGGQQQRVAIARAIVVGAAAGADGRAAVQPRRQAAAGDARRDPPHPQHARLLHDLRDARPGGGAVARRPHRGDDRGPDAPDRHAGGALCPPGARRRRRVHGLPQPARARAAEVDGRRRRGQRRPARAWPARRSSAVGGRGDGGDPAGGSAPDAATARSPPRWRSPNITAATSTPSRAAPAARLFFRSRRVAGRLSARRTADACWSMRRARRGGELDARAPPSSGRWVLRRQ